MKNTKTILVSVLVGLAVGSIISFFVVSRLQLSVKPNQSQAGLFIRRCATERQWYFDAETNYALTQNSITLNIVHTAARSYENCMGY